MADAQLDIIIRARDQASRALRNIRGATGRLGGALAKLGKIAVLGAAAGLVALGVAALKFGSDFQSAFSTIRIGTGATGEALNALEQDFKNALGQVPESMDKVATATADLNTRLGLTGKPLTDMTVKMLDLARITESDVGETIAASTRVFGDWSIATEDQADALDHMFKVSQNTGIGVNALQQKVVQFGAPLRQMGFNFEEATVLMGKWEKEGVNSEAILGALKIGVANFAKEGVDASTGLQNFIKQVQDMGPGFDATNLAIETFGSRAGPDMVAAVLEGRFAIEDLSKVVAASGETIQGAAKDARTWQENLSILKNRVLVKLEPVLTKLIDKLTEFTDWLSREGIPLAEEFGKTLQEKFGPAVEFLREAFNKLKPKVEAAGRVMIRIFEFLNSNREILAAVAIAIGVVLVPSIIAWTVATIANTVAHIALAAATLLAYAPIILLIAAIALLALGIILLVKHWDEVTAFLKAAWSATMAFLLASVGQLRDFFVGNFARIKDFVISAWTATVSFIVEKATWVKDQIVAKWGTMKTKVMEIITGIKDGIVGKFNEVVGFVTGLGSRLFDAGKSAFDALGDGIRAGLNIAIGVVESGLNRVIRGIAKIIRKVGKGMNFLPGNPGQPVIDFADAMGTISIPRLAHGAIVRHPTLALLGEAGDEAIIPLNRAGAFAGIGGATVNFYGGIQLSGSATREDADALIDMVQEGLRSRLRRGS